MLTRLVYNDIPADSPCAGWPQWRRTLLYDKTTGEVWAPADATPCGATAAVFAAVMAGDRLQTVDGHHFLRLAWLAAAYGADPGWAELYAQTASNVEALMGGVVP